MVLYGRVTSGDWCSPAAVVSGTKKRIFCMSVCLSGKIIELISVILKFFPFYLFIFLMMAVFLNICRRFSCFYRVTS